MEKSKQDSLKIALAIVIVVLTVLAIWMTSVLIDNAVSKDIGKYKGEHTNIQLPTLGKHLGGH